MLFNDFHSMLLSELLDLNWLFEMSTFLKIDLVILNGQRVTKMVSFKNCHVAWSSRKITKSKVIFVKHFKALDEIHTKGSLLGGTVCYWNVKGILWFWFITAFLSEADHQFINSFFVIFELSSLCRCDRKTGPKLNWP